MPEKTLGRTLVIRGGALGDFLLTLPLLQSLGEACSHLGILAYPQLADLVREAGVVDEARSIEYGPLAGFFARGAVTDPALREYFSSFDAVVSYLYDPDGIFEGNLRGSGVKRFITGPHKPGPGAHAIDQLAKPLLDLGLGSVKREADLRLPGVTPQPGLIAIHAGSGSRDKIWPAVSWKALVRGLLSHDPRLRIALIAGEADSAAIEALEELRSEDRVVFWENLPLCTLARNLAAARGYLGHDTGVSHLAAVLGIPSLLLFGPTDPAVWAPPHRHVQTLRAPENDLAQLSEASVLAAAGKHLLPGLLA